MSIAIAKMMATAIPQHLKLKGGNMYFDMVVITAYLSAIYLMCMMQAKLGQWRKCKCKQ